MVDKQFEVAPEAIEAVVCRLGDLEAALGPSVRPILGAVRTRLITAMAARDRGEMLEAISDVAMAMEELAACADDLDPAEAAAMRMASRSLRVALLRGDEPGARGSAAAMLERSGARERQRTR
ncbi:hypothetical protein L6Q96_09625 [Candidatus Binatia bacterium]|nr:hypothetical protein [Candidatus Binatia bacterium]